MRGRHGLQRPPGAWRRWPVRVREGTGGGLAKIDIACAAFRQFQVPVDDVLCFVQNIHILHSASGLDVYIVAPSTYN